MLLTLLGRCHTCGKKHRGVAWCSKRCQTRAVIRVGDMVVLDSGYTPGENGIPFKVKEAMPGGCFRGSVRGKSMVFNPWQAAKMGTKRAEVIINKRKVFIAKGG